jgi:hypothetical protein
MSTLDLNLLQTTNNEHLRHLISFIMLPGRLIEISTSFDSSDLINVMRTKK